MQLLLPETDVYKRQIYACVGYDNARAVVDDALCNVKYAHDDVPSICYQQHLSLIHIYLLLSKLFFP